MRSPSKTRSRILGAAAVAGATLVAAGSASLAPATAAHAAAFAPPPVKHVWLIILENKGYDSTFTGLNNNTYLWQTLPSQGAVLKNYFGTSHFSLGNYTSLISGQGPAPDNQSDCPTYKNASPGTIISSGDVNNGQTNATSGCVYPSGVPTLFNQLDTGGVSWKGYMQDLGNTTGREGGPCGAPSGSPAGAGVPDPGRATPADQYVPKHSPFPWFHSLIDNSADCGTGLDSGTAGRVVNLKDPNQGLEADLAKESSTPSFSWISPNNCSDAHDAVCKGDNLSGGANNVGGLYASDLFLEKYIPKIEASPAFKDGGLIDITFDEGFPPYTQFGNSFHNSSATLNAAKALEADAAVNNEPTGPNTSDGPPVVNDKVVEEGPGFGAFLHRTIASIPGARTDTVTASPSSTTITDASIVTGDQGRGVSGAGIPAGSTVGSITAASNCVAFPSEPCNVPASFTLQPGAPTGAVASITLTAQSPANDPLYDPTDPTPGGGRTGSVLISPYITPGTVSSVDYNHYNWLRSMEDLFKVRSGGLDNQGHLGFAGQSGLQSFGADVYTNPSGTTPSPVVPETPLAVGLPVGAGLIGAAALVARRRRHHPGGAHA